MTEFFCTTLFDGTAWQQDVTVRCGDDGRIAAVIPDSACPEGVEVLPIVLPGFVNSHSHGFQALFAGLAEHRLSATDDFWSWRKQMYHCAAALQLEDIEPLYTYLYRQMLAAGYTQVCEFHYLHHAPSGQGYQPLTAVADAIRRAAANAGIGLTMLPVWYRYSQFGRQPTHDGQKRFAMDEALWRDYLQALGEVPDSANYQLGVAAHSLRAVAIEDIPLLSEPLHGRQRLPLHIHIAEQQKEVADCVAAYGKRPVQLFLDQPAVAGQVWSLVHATHLTAEEQDQLAASSSVAVLCPTTEANLGDGAFPYAEFLSREGRIAIGSDSQVSLLPFTELQLMEYTARLAARQRSVLASADEPSPATRLLRGISGSAEATSGLPLGRIAPGYRCDLISYEPEAADFPALAASDPAKEGSTFLDYLLVHKPFAKPQRVIVNGCPVYEHSSDEAVRCHYRKEFMALRQSLALS